jgi:D-alanyl-D-alanine dipeptidase
MGGERGDLWRRDLASELDGLFVTKLLPLTEQDGFLFDIRYATPDNLTGKPIYTRPVAMLRPEAHSRLCHAAARAGALGLRMKVFDAFRPIEAQWALWYAVSDKSFVADPRLGGTHPRGMAVDLTLVDSTTGEDLPMGTGFDEVSPLSSHACLDVPLEAQRNRALLLGLMTASGWEHYVAEWWHYNLPRSDRFAPLAASAVPDGPM